MDGIKKKKRHFDMVMLSELEDGDRFHFLNNKDVYTFDRYSKNEKGWLFTKDGNYKETIRKSDCKVKFLRNIK